MRRLRTLVLVFALLLFPVSAFAGGAAGDPYGGNSSDDLTAPAPADWLDSIFRVLVVYLGI